MNLLLLPTAILACAFMFAGMRAGERLPKRFQPLLWLLALLLAVPALVFAAYYRHLFDHAAWFYELRSLPFVELSAGGLGFLAGLAIRATRRIPTRSIRFSLLAFQAVAFALVLMFPYAKPIVAPLRVTRANTWKDGVCIQSTPSTCGPSSVATVLNQFGIHVTEDELARECYTYGAGTENWYMARAMRRRGISAEFVVESPQPEALRFPAIAGVQLGGQGGTGHFIAILGQSEGSYVVGDPMRGRMTLPLDKLKKRYYFTGFFLVANRA